jgi:hypothetical protein
MSDPIPVVLSEKFTAEGYEFTVKESCGVSTGQWFCVTHMEAFRNNIEKDFHISKGEHRLAWMCFEHGPEVP